MKIKIHDQLFFDSEIGKLRGLSVSDSSGGGIPSGGGISALKDAMESHFSNDARIP